MPQIFGIEHIIYLIINIIGYIVGIILINKVKDEKMKMIIKIVAAILLIMVVLNRISVAFIKYHDAYELVPSTFCGFSSFTLAIATLFGKKDNLYFHFICPLGFLGAILTLAYPDFIGQAASVFYLPTITGLLHHSIMLFLIIILTIKQYYIPTIKKWYALPIGLGLTMLLGVFEVYVIGLKDAFYLNSPILPGTILYWYVLGPIALAILYSCIGLFDLVRIKKIKPKHH